ncbi:hypothetical protein ONE63_001566 [Megalurothrips usitatus]|uniref:Uncharacterized protein n=1 Tax=Megalurothrips usitatus TaxID=439358 RepID=A0AAV7XG81_9NEOP|nr:hypothetical protein ONE63_001566 [Megalurothrips usitatus]
MPRLQLSLFDEERNEKAKKGLRERVSDRLTVWTASAAPHKIYIQISNLPAPRSSGSSRRRRARWRPRWTSWRPTWPASATRTVCPPSRRWPPPWPCATTASTTSSGSTWPGRSACRTATRRRRKGCIS